VEPSLFFFALSCRIGKFSKFNSDKKYKNDLENEKKYWALFQKIKKCAARGHCARAAL
jgi:hypothetical protein